MNGLITPSGSKSLTDNFKTDAVGGNDVAIGMMSFKSKQISSVSISQLNPNIFTLQSSAFRLGATFKLFSSASVILCCRNTEFVLYFLRLKSPAYIIFLALWYNLNPSSSLYTLLIKSLT